MTNTIPVLQSSGGRKGFSLVELILVLVIGGIILAWALPSVSGLVSGSNDMAAIAGARAINNARMAYKVRVPTAASTWASAASDSARFDLIKDRLVGLTNTGSLSAFTPTGYTYALGSSINATVAITNSSGATVSY